MWLREVVDLATLRRAPAWFSRVGEKRHRWFGADEHEMFEVFEKIYNLFGEIGKALDCNNTRAARQSRSERITQQSRASSCGNSPPGIKTLRLQGSTAHKNGALLAGTQCLGYAIDLSGGDRRGIEMDQRRCWTFRIFPRRIGRENKCCDLTWRLSRSLHGAGPVRSDSPGTGACVDPAGYRACELSNRFQFRPPFRVQ